VGFVVDEVGNEHVTPWRHIGRLPGVPWRDGYGGVGGRSGGRDRVVCACRQCCSLKPLTVESADSRY
jgi:hypothetical protein